MKSVPIAMPAAMTRPIEKRALAPAPDAMISGTTPKTMAAVVIRIGRSRTRAASMIASCFGIPASRCWLANCTIRMPCLVMSPISVIRPTCV